VIGWIFVVELSHLLLHAGSSRRFPPSTIMSPTRNHPGSRTEIRPGARTHHTPRPDQAHAPPNHQAIQPSNPEPRLTGDACTDKEPSPPWLGRRDRVRGEPAARRPTKAAARRLRSPSRGSACASSGLCSRPPRVARQLNAWHSTRAGSPGEAMEASARESSAPRRPDRESGRRGVRGFRRMQGRSGRARERPAAYAESPRPLRHEGPAGHVRSLIPGDRNVALCEVGSRA